MFKTKDTAEYYNTTQGHYQNWWNLDDTLSLHYGIWGDHTKTFADSLVHTNALMLAQAEVQQGSRVLDAGCGVGGAAFFMHHEKKALVTGITLSTKQVEFARKKAKALQLSNEVSFEVMDYTQTNFPSESFDVVWACESICHCNNKKEFLQEAYRLLKKGGRLILCDYFLAADDQKDPRTLIKKWTDTWTITNLVSSTKFTNQINECGFSKVQSKNYTSAIQKSAKRMYYAGVIGALPSIAYNLLYPKTPELAKNHYKGCLYQYWALKKGLWEYQMFCAVK